MVGITLKRGEAIGLGVALALHAGLVAVLLMQPERQAVLPPPPERMTVSLATDVGLEATAPDPVPVSRAATAPTLAPEPAPDMSENTTAEAEPSPPRPQPQPAPRVQREPEPRAAPRPQPRATASSRPTPQRTAAPDTRPAPAAKPAPARTAAAKPAASTPRRSGGSRIGADFLPGAGSSETSSETRTVAAAFGATEQAALSAAINRQLKPHWRAPQGVDADRLVTVLAWELNENGSLKGKPRVVSQSGINDSNRPQAELHAEQAIRAVQLAAPFKLPSEFYDKWKRIRDWRFDRRL